VRPHIALIMALLLLMILGAFFVQVVLLDTSQEVGTYDPVSTTTLSPVSSFPRGQWEKSRDRPADKRRVFRRGGRAWGGLGGLIPWSSGKPEESRRPPPRKTRLLSAECFRLQKLLRALLTCDSVIGALQGHLTGWCSFLGKSRGEVGTGGELGGQA